MNPTILQEAEHENPNVQKRLRYYQTGAKKQLECLRGCNVGADNFKQSVKTAKEEWLKEASIFGMSQAMATGLWVEWIEDKVFRPDPFYEELLKKNPDLFQE